MAVEAWIAVPSDAMGAMLGSFEKMSVTIGKKVIGVDVRGM